MSHPALASGSVAVVTGGANGIGLACARRLATLGLRVCIADHADPARLRQAAAIVASASPRGADAVLALPYDVSDPEAVRRLEQTVRERWGGTDVLMNNAAVQPGSTVLGPLGAWEQVLGINLWGIIHGVQAFVPGMIARGRPGLVVNTGSKQGITTPPGDPAYNVAKAGVKALTEALAHELRNTEGCRLTAHLLIPGFVWTGLTAGNRTEKPDAAWTSEQVAEFLLPALERGDFYVLCPDNAVSRALDERRILWAAGDIVHNRPALSRWHPDYTAAFEAFARGE